MMGGRILVLAPHPDDEIVACGIAALRARTAGARVFVLYLTTGVPERAALWPWQRPGYAGRVGRRREEALAVAALFGLEPVLFRETPSRRLREGLDHAAADLDHAVRGCGADALWVPAFEGGHQDHDAANALAASFAGRLPVWEFAAYNFAGGRVGSNRFAAPRGGEIALDATDAEAERKRRALGCYVSERGNLGHVGAGHEACRPLSAYDYGAKPNAGRLFRERFHWIPFRHPRVDFAPSSEVYRDIGSWIGNRGSAGKAERAAMLGDRPSCEPRQPDRELSRALDEPQSKRALAGEPGEGGERDQGGFLRAPAGGNQEGGAARTQRQAFEESSLGKPG